jgi:hypothetical protein
MDLNLQQMTGSSIGGYRSSSNMNAIGLNSTARKLFGGKRMYQSSKKSRKHHKIGRYI